MIDAGFVRTDGGSAANGLVSSVTPLFARTFGIALVERDLFRPSDRFSVAVRKPLRVISGSANITTASVDANGYTTMGTSRVGLTPSGSQTDFTLGYNAPLGTGIDFSAATSFSQDAGNERGATDASFRLGLNVKF